MLVFSVEQTKALVLQTNTEPFQRCRAISSCEITIELLSNQGGHHPSVESYPVRRL